MKRPDHQKLATRHFSVLVSVLFLTLSVAAVPAQAALAACGGTAATNASVGCFSVDLGFSNFASTGSGAPATTGILLPAGTGGVVSGNTISPIIQTFNYQNAAVGANGTWILNFAVTESDQHGVTPPTNGLSWGLTQMRVDSGTLTGGTGNTQLHITLALCNSTFTTCGTSVSSGTGVSVTPSPFLTVNTLQSTFFVQAQIIFTSKTGNPSFGQFAIEFDQGAEVPEPATFGLLGASLAGLAFAARRRRKTQ